MWVRLSSVLSIIVTHFLLDDLWCITPSLHASNGPNDSHGLSLGCMVIDNVGLRGPLVPKTNGKCVIFQKNPHLYVYLLTTRLPVATKMILQILSDSGILRVAWNTVDPYTLPASHHIFFRSNGIIKCDRNIKYSRAALGFKFWNSRGLWRPIFCQFHLRSRASIEIFVLDIHNIFLLGEQLSLRWIQTISYL